MCSCLGSHSCLVLLGSQQLLNLHVLSTGNNRHPGRTNSRPKGRFSMQPRLTRSRTEVIIAGVCGGLAEYFAIDPVIVRLIFVLVTLTSGIGLLVYPILWMVMPRAGATAS